MFLICSWPPVSTGAGPSTLNSRTGGLQTEPRPGLLPGHSGTHTATLSSTRHEEAGGSYRLAKSGRWPRGKRSGVAGCVITDRHDALLPASFSTQAPSHTPHARYSHGHTTQQKTQAALGWHRGIRPCGWQAVQKIESLRHLPQGTATAR